VASGRQEKDIILQEKTAGGLEDHLLQTP